LRKRQERRVLRNLSFEKKRVRAMGFRGRNPLRSTEEKKDKMNLIQKVKWSEKRERTKNAFARRGVGGTALL